MLIFDRKASGNTKPLRVIRGPKTQLAGSQQMAITPQGWILCGAQGGSIGIWNIKDDGDATEGFVDDEDIISAKAKNLSLEDMVNGYPDDTKGKK